jgi:hypothetical protein
MWGNATDKVTDAVILVLSEELREKLREKRKCGPKCRNWIARRDHLGHRTVCFVNYLVKIRKNTENTWGWA